MDFTHPAGFLRSGWLFKTLHKTASHNLYTLFPMVLILLISEHHTEWIQSSGDVIFRNLVFEYVVVSFTFFASATFEECAFISVGLYIFFEYNSTAFPHRPSSHSLKITSTLFDHEEKYTHQESTFLTKISYYPRQVIIDNCTFLGRVDSENTFEFLTRFFSDPRSAARISVLNSHFSLYEAKISVDSDCAALFHMSNVALRESFVVSLSDGGPDGEGGGILGVVLEHCSFTGSTEIKPRLLRIEDASLVRVSDCKFHSYPLACTHGCAILVKGLPDYWKQREYIITALNTFFSQPSCRNYKL